MMIRWPVLWCCAVFMLASVGPAGANDSVGRIAAGGIVFESTRDIEMVSELLEISVVDIKVSYIFKNHSAEELTKTILFPLPLKQFYDELENVSKFYAGSFFVSVNEVPVETKLIQRAVLNGQDITQSLREMGLPDEMIFDYEGCDIDEEVQLGSVCNLMPDQVAGLEGLGISGDALWQVQEVVTWEQHFPARSEIKVSHFYAPSVGRNIYYLPGENGSGAEGVGAGFMKSHADVCIDESTSRAIERRVGGLYKSGARVVSAYVADVEYILSTGRNWRGPIGDFRLRVKKSLPEELVSLCFPGKPVKKDALTYEFQQKNYVPQDGIVIEFFSFNAFE